MRPGSGTTAKGRRHRRAPALGVAVSAALAVVVAAPMVPAASAAPVEGAALSWGRNVGGQLGNGTTTERSTPGSIPGALQSRVVQVAAGAFHGIALRSNGRVWTWGFNSSGEIGDGTTGSRLAPVQVNALRDVVEVAASPNDSYALRSDGTVWAFGDNLDGQLGDGTTASFRTSPVQVSGLTGITQVDAGNGFAVAVRNDGTVWAWGNNDFGQLGDGTTTGRRAPVRALAPSGISRIAAGFEHTVALRSDGTVWAWGFDVEGQLGDGGLGPSIRAVPAQVPGLTGVTSVAAGQEHTLAVSGGRVFAWGGGSEGELGDGTERERDSPVQLPGLSGITSVNAGNLHSFALTSDHRVFGWGFNLSGQLGDGTTIQRDSPVQIPGLTTVQQIDGGSGFTLAVVT